MGTRYRSRAEDDNRGFRSEKKQIETLDPPDWTRIQLHPFEKCFYREDRSVSCMTEQEVGEFLRSSEITVNGYNVPRPVTRFEQSGFPERIVRVFDKLGFENPTPIQSQAWPVILSGRDMIGIAQTGSGKTFAYLLPAIVHLQSQVASRCRNGPIVLVVCPTRELAQQVHEVALIFERVCEIRSVCLFGGASKRPQIYQLRRGADIVIATPGRLIDLVSQNEININYCTYLVLDEADRMLDMGFEPQIRSIIGQIRGDRQTVMFSATWPKEVVNLAREFLNNSVQVNIGQLSLQANHNIKQIVEIVTEDQKLPKLLTLLTKLGQRRDKFIIFVSRKLRSDTVAINLRNAGVRALCLHGGKSQDVRHKVLYDFRSGRKNILVATDVAARGLDIPDVNYVINYDFPMTIEDYVHRIGRTGRANRDGTAYTFLTHEEGKLSRQLIGILQEAKQEVPPELFDLSSRSYGRNDFRQRYGYKSRPFRGSLNNRFQKRFEGFPRRDNYSRYDAPRYDGFRRFGNEEK